MYRKRSEGWLKHFDFIVLDLICLQLAFLLSYFVRHGLTNPYSEPLYRNMAIFVELASIAVIFFFETLKDVLKRGYYKEFMATLRHAVVVELLAVLYLNTIQGSGLYSRFSLYLMGPFYFILTYIVRILWKKRLSRRMQTGGDRSLLVLTTEEVAPAVVHELRTHNYDMYRFAGLVILDRDRTGEQIEGLPVVASQEDAPLYVCRQWIDEVLLVPAQDYQYPRQLVDQLVETGVTVHINLAKVADVPGQRQLVEHMGNYTVLTTSINYATSRQAALKRMFDIVCGLAGCLLTALVCLVVAPAIYLSSPGPIFFTQERVGLNGKKFKIYKFRSMYMDAEERKAELMKQNRVDSGLMFKLDFDPRVIGNKILPDGTKKTGLGNLIRVTSIDELPQFFNVLKGDMSMVGTRPPTVEEWNQYELHHRARLAIKPGLTGMWQVSGRSQITDFEEVVKLDTEYITHWSMGLDFRIMWKTVGVVLRRDGSM